MSGKTASIIALILLLWTTASATNYYVSPSGNDDDDGLDSTTAWASIDNGDTKGILIPGDTVNILTGTYLITGSVQLTTSGTAAASVVYRKFGESSVVVDADGDMMTILQIDGDHVRVEGLELTNSLGNAVAVNGDSCIVADCYVRDINNSAVSVPGSDNTILRCRISNIMTHAILNGPTGHDNLYYGNTIYGATIGINMGPVQTARIFNNIITSIETGVQGGAGNVCGFNDVWNYSSADYSGGTSDSAGGISDEPRFADAAGGDFTLQADSPCIGAGLDLGYPFEGAAPDMGAMEYIPYSGNIYWVSPTGDDDNDGISPETAWWSMDNGDQKGILVPGDTVNVLPGTYVLTRTFQLKTSGSESLPIVYRKVGKAKAVLDGNNKSNIILLLEGNHVAVEGLYLTNTAENAIHIKSDSCTIRNCDIFDVNKNGIRIEGIYSLILRNVISGAAQCGIKNEGPGESSRLYGNTIYSCQTNGIELKEKTSRVFNNIIVQNDVGIKGSNENICGFNNVWGNFSADYDGAVDSAGGISRLPKFVDPASGRFDLKEAAFEIDAGLDLGYFYNGPAPDMGAREKYNVYYVSLTGDDQHSGRTTDSAWATIDNGDSLLFPGDTVHILAGTYYDPVVITDSGLVDDMITYVGEQDSSRIDGSGFTTAVRIISDFVFWSGIDVSDASNSNIHVSGNSNIIRRCLLGPGNKYGIKLDLNGNNKILKNVFIENALSGVFTSADSTRIYNCTFYESGNTAIDALGSDYNYITNCIFEGVGSANVAVQAASSSQVTYSIFCNHNQPVQGGVSLGTGCLIENPLMVAPDSGNYRLSSLSPAIDAGTEIGLPFNGPAPDMGAYETGILADLTITPVYDSLFADSTYQFDVIAVDTGGNPVSPGVLQWAHTFASGDIDSSGLFVPELVGPGEIIVESDINGIVDTSVTMDVVAGSLDSISISPDRDTISADSTRQFSATGFDIKGNAVPDVGTLDWEVTNDIGSIDAGGLFDAVNVGAGFIQVSSDLGVSAMTDTITVIPGEVVTLDVIPPENVIAESSDYQYIAFGYDADSNYVRELTDSVAWVTDDPAGSVTPQGLYTAGNILSPPEYYIVATYKGSISDSGSVSVISDGSLDHIMIEWSDGTVFGDTTLNTDNDTTRLYCRGYDSADSLLGDVSVTWNLIGIDSIGSVVAGPSTSTRLTLTGVGAGQVTAFHSAPIADTSGVITSVPGATAGISISPHTVTVSADSTVQFTADQYDADGNPIFFELVLSWNALGGIGTIDSEGLFTPSTVGIGYIVADNGEFADTTGPVTVTPGDLDHITVVPDSAIVSADSTRQFSALGYDARDNLCDPGEITWDLTAVVGTIDSSGLFDAVSAGEAQVVATSSLGPIDSSSYLEVIPGRLVQLTIAPDSIEVTTDSTVAFDAQGIDSDGNSANPGILAWEVIGEIGDVNSLGLFTPLTVGTGRVAVLSSIDSVNDTNKIIIVNPGILNHLLITPDTATLKVNESAQFSAIGFDAKFNPTDVGELNWEAAGGIGIIDSSGLFIATAPGTGNIMVASSINDVSDVSGTITVEALDITAIPLGNAPVFPGQGTCAVLAFRLDNSFATSTSINSITLRDNSRGTGTIEERLTNVDSISLYLDSDDNLAFTPADSLIAIEEFISVTSVLSFDPFMIPAGSGRTIFAGATINLYPHDGDTLDLFLLPETDVQTPDGTTVIGPDTVNSFGYNVIDGLVSDQITVAATGLDSISPSDSILCVFAAGIPANGYLSDTLNLFSMTNSGTATVADIDSLFLYRDNGDNIWGGAADEIYLCQLTFTGNRWTRSGLAVPLEEPLNRFYIGARLAAYPTSGATLAFSIPRDGLEMSSDNDGPIDAATQPIETIVIESYESLALATLTIPRKELIPGESSGPILGLRFTNSYSNPISLDSIRFNLMAIDPGGATQAQLDSQIDSLQFYLDGDDDIDNLGPEDSLIASVSLSNGKCLLDSDALPVPGNGGTVELAVVAWLDANNCKNDNLINIGIADVADIFPAQPVTIDAAFPLKNNADFIINAFPAASITATTIESATYFGGQTNKPVLDIILPGNGYAADALNSLSLANNGTLNDPNALLLIELWADLPDSGLIPDHLNIGRFKYDGESWNLGGLSYPVGTAGQRFIVTVDIGSGQFEAGTVQFAVGVEGAEYLSGMTGPDDVEVENPEAQLVFPANRITVISIPAYSRPVFPGTQKNQILTFALYNGYINQVHTLTAVNLANATKTKSDAAFADYELGQASLYFDSDDDRALDGDSLVGSGYFENGILQLSGLDIHLPAESLSYFFAVVDVPQEMIDNDSLAVEIIGPSDLSFSEPVNINGDLPISGGGYLIVDGSVKSQYRIVNLTPHTLSPGDSSVVLYAFRPALNGDQIDTLQSLSLRNLGSADTSDIESLRLWLDLDGDSLWQASDSLLGPLAYIDGTWEIDSIGLTVEADAPIVMAVGDIAAMATPNASFKGEIPLGGCEYSSENDGPVDVPLTGDCIFTISNSSLRITHSHLSETYSAGQPIEVKITATNLLTTPIDTVLGEVVEIDNPTLVVLDSSHAGPMSLAAGDSTDFVFYYTAVQVGTLSWQVRAVAPTLPDSSPTVQIDTVQIQAIPTDVTVQLINSIPTAVIRGQPNVFPLSIKCPHPDSSLTSAALRLDSIRLNVEDGSGAPLPADEVFSRMVLATGYTNLTILENPPGQSSVPFVFDQPVIVPSGQQQILSLLVDIDSLASPDDFALSIASAQAITIVDNNTYQPVPLDPAVSFPLTTALCRIDDPSWQVVVSDSSLLKETINYGQTDVDVMQLRLRHPGAAGSSQIQLTKLSVAFADEWSDPIAPSQLFDRVRLMRQQTVVAEAINLEDDTSGLELILSSPVTLSPGEIDSVVIQVWVKDYSTHTGFSLRINDSTAFVVRDLSSGSLLLAATDTMFTLATESVFPIASEWTDFKHPALEPEVCITSGLPSSVVGGTDSLVLFELSVHYPAGNDYSSIRLDEIFLAVLDTLDQPLNPDRLFDRIGFCFPGQLPVYQPFIRLENGNAVFELDDDALIFGPGDSTTVRLIGDIEADAPFDHFVLVIPSESDISIIDVNDDSHRPGFTIEDQCSAEFPFATGATRIFLPAGRPVLTVTSMPVQIAFPGQTGVKFFDVELDYSAETLQGDLALSELGGAIFEQIAQGAAALEGSRLFEAVYFRIDTQVVAIETGLTGDTLNLTLDSNFVIHEGSDINLTLLCDIKETAPVGNYFIGFADSTFLDIADRNLQTVVYPLLPGGSYPLQTTIISLEAATLEKSFTNYPNPFNPSRGEVTTIGFVLTEPAYVDIEMFTITGEAVKKIAVNSYRLPGPHQWDVWSSENDQGLDVLPGTYFCRITARYDTGRTETFKRKVSVVR